MDRNCDSNKGGDDDDADDDDDDADADADADDVMMTTIMNDSFINNALLL